MSEKLTLEDLQNLTECVDYYRYSISMNSHQVTKITGLIIKLEKAIRVESERRYALEMQHFERLGV